MFWHSYVLKMVWRLKMPEKPFTPVNACPLSAYFTNVFGHALFDEFGHFQHERGKSSAKELYKALRPAVGTFGSDGLLLLSSSAPPESTWASDFVEEQFKSSNSDYLVVKFPSWWVNRAPDIIKDIKAAFKESKESALSEYDTQYASRGSTWIDPSYIIKSQEHITLHRKPYFFLGFDLAEVDDATSIAVISPTEEGIFDVADYEYFAAGEGPLQQVEVVPPALIAKSILRFYQKFNILMSVCDQFEQLSFGALLPPQILSTFKSIHFNGTYNSIQNLLFQSVITNNAIHIGPSIHSSLIESLTHLQSYFNNGQLIVTHSAGVRKDPADAVMRAILACFLFNKEHPNYFSFMPSISLFDPMHSIALSSMIQQPSRMQDLASSSMSLGLTTGFQMQDMPHTPPTRDFSQFFQNAARRYAPQGPHDIQRRH
jgi:hypothetical protein